MISCSSENKVILDKFIIGGTQVLVGPVHILDNQESSYDAISSNKIVNYINKNKYANASTTKLYPPANNKWRANEAKMLSESINLFREFVKESHFPYNTYILYVEFLKHGQNSKVGGIHYCLLNYNGEIAMRGLINSKWKAYQKVKPRTNDDCVDVFINGFEERMNKK